MAVGRSGGSLPVWGKFAGLAEVCRSVGSLPVCGKLDCLCASGLQPKFSEGDLKGASPVTSKLILKEKGKP